MRGGLGVPAWQEHGEQGAGAHGEGQEVSESKKTTAHSCEEPFSSFWVNCLIYSPERPRKKGMTSIPTLEERKWRLRGLQ